MDRYGLRVTWLHPPFLVGNRILLQASAGIKRPFRFRQCQSFVLRFFAQGRVSPRRTAVKFEGFLHLNIRCSESDLPAIEKFYGEVLGLRKGYRPDFMFNGIWLYDGDDPIVNVGASFPNGSFVA